LKSLALLHASQLVTLAGPKRPRVGKELAELGIIRDGGMLIRDGKVGIVGPSDEVERNLTGLTSQVSGAEKDIEVVDLGGRGVLPGFVDAHTQLGIPGKQLDDLQRLARGEADEQLA